MYDNVFLAKIVSFSEFTLLLDTNELDMPFEKEEYRMVAVYDDWAYDLETFERTHIIDMVDGIIPDEEIDKLKPGLPYVYDMSPLLGFWNSISKVFNIQDKPDTYLEPRTRKALEIHEQLQKNKKLGTIIDIFEARQYINRRKY